MATSNLKQRDGYYKEQDLHKGEDGDK